MSVRVEEVEVVEIIEGTPGGDTNIAVLPGGGRERKLCLRPLHNTNGKRLCTNPAGYKTDHPGTGACIKHGGKNTEVGVRLIKTGRRAFSTKNRLRGDIQRYLDLDRKELLDLTEEFATMRAVLNEYMEIFPYPQDDEYESAVRTVQGIISTMGTLVDKISKVESRNSLTNAQVLYIRATIVDLFVKYITDLDVRDKALRELVSRMGGEAEVEMLPSEVSKPGNVT